MSELSPADWLATNDYDVNVKAIFSGFEPTLARKIEVKPIDIFELLKTLTATQRNALPIGHLSEAIHGSGGEKEYERLLKKVDGAFKNHAKDVKFDVSTGSQDQLAKIEVLLTAAHACEALGLDSDTINEQYRECLRLRDIIYDKIFASFSPAMQDAYSGEMEKMSTNGKQPRKDLAVLLSWARC